jgi:hypothetical protein
MARYRDYSYEQTKLIPIAFSNQILPGTFEYTLNYLIDNEFDLSRFVRRHPRRPGGGALNGKHFAAYVGSRPEAVLAR